MSLIRTIILGIAALALGACTTMVPREKLPYPLTNETFGDPTKVVTIPLPVIATSPNEGATVGALSAFLLHNARDEVSTLLAPQINYNQNFGTTFTLYGAFFPRPDRNWELNLSKSTKVNEAYEFRIRDKSLLEGKLETNAYLFRISDGSARFFGFQSDSLKTNETNYADQEVGFTASVGYDIADNLQLVVGERVRKVWIRPGAVKNLPFIHDRFTAAEIPGIDGFVAHAQKIALVYSTLDSRDMPTKGLYARAAIEGSAKLLGSDAGYRHYEAETKGYFPLADARYISVVRLAYNQTLGSDVPFLERSILGGENTLRGYGRNRFIDSSYLLCNLEERIRLFRWSVFDVNTDWEIAPFLDLGAVMESLDKAKAKSFEFNPGIGFRAVVRPNIVGRVDLGVGKDGPAVFVGLGYPF
ncbi:BamA/TamA family outer membrane protein [Geobacter sp.]|uniref:BamA/TamA family outer membrane protein n=1 Tax=Geobacter sp. TaxID=46610 RepID=UPI00261EC149|nr:BamA/TamA family outer membrane protein [Geobacter sp.]